MQIPVTICTLVQVFIHPRGASMWIWMSIRYNGSQGLMGCIVIAVDWTQTSNDSFGSSSLTSLLVCFVETSDRKNPVSSLFNVINNWPLVLKFGFPVVKRFLYFLACFVYPVSIYPGIEANWVGVDGLLYIWTVGRLIWWCTVCLCFTWAARDSPPEVCVCVCVCVKCIQESWNGVQWPLSPITWLQFAIIDFCLNTY